MIRQQLDGTLHAPQKNNLDRRRGKVNTQCDAQVKVKVEVCNFLSFYCNEFAALTAEPSLIETAPRDPLRMAAVLEQQILCDSAIHPSSVAKDTARVHIRLSAAHSLAEVDRLRTAFKATQ